MKKVDTAELLSRLEGQVESHIADTVRLFQNHDNEFLNQLPASGGWSIAQCLEHLNSYGLYYLPRMRREIEKSPVWPNAFFESTWAGAKFTKMMDPKTGKRKYKAMKGHIPASTLNAAQVVATFIDQQEEMLGLLRAAADKNLNAMKVGISILPFIKLRMGDVFQFMIAHNERHMQQAKRNLIPNSVAAPALLR